LLISWKNKNIMEKITKKCPFCEGTGLSSFVDMVKIPVGTKMVIGDDTWERYEEYEPCIEGCKDRI
jgi:hypothetical protein